LHKAYQVILIGGIIDLKRGKPLKTKEKYSSRTTLESHLKLESI